MYVSVFNCQRSRYNPMIKSFDEIKLKNSFLSNKWLWPAVFHYIPPLWSRAANEDKTFPTVWKIRLTKALLYKGRYWLYNNTNLGWIHFWGSWSSLFRIYFYYWQEERVHIFSSLLSLSSLLTSSPIWIWNWKSWNFK